MMKKLAVVTVGVSAGLMMAAPFASATESHHDGGDDHGSSSSEGCSFVGGTGEGSTGGTGSGLLAGVGGASVGGIGGNNVGNALNCSDFLNDNLNGNSVGSDNTVGPAAPAIPVIPAP